MFALEHMDHRLKELRFLLRLLQLHLQLLDALLGCQRLGWLLHGCGSFEAR
ncbi:hypothetical protein D3C72_2418630 [compost metagenome]